MNASSVTLRHTGTFCSRRSCRSLPVLEDQQDVEIWTPELDIRPTASTIKRSSPSRPLSYAHLRLLSSLRPLLGIIQN